MFHRSESFHPKEDELTLKERAEDAMDQARPLFEAESDDAFAAKIASDFISGRTSLAVFLDKYDSLRSDDLEPGELELASLAELEEFLADFFGDKELAHEFVDNEKARLAAINQAGWKYKILFRFFRNEAGGLCGRPAVAPDVPESGDEDEIRKNLKLIMNPSSDADDIGQKPAGKR